MLSQMVQLTWFSSVDNRNCHVMGIFCQLCLSVQASGYTYDLAPLRGGLYTRKRNGCSSRRRRIGKSSHRSRMAAIHSISQSKDSEAFVQPLKLLQSTPANFNLRTSLEEELQSSSDFSQSLYRVELTTSNDSSSDLSDTNAGILLCIIGENGNSIIQRFPALLPTSQVLSSGTSKIVQQNCDRIHFQKGSVDGLTFWGPDIGKLVALWIGPESGSWRLSRISVLVIPPSQRVDRRTDNLEKQNCENIGFYYSFQTNEVMLGEGGDSAVELRASGVQEVSGSDTWTKSLNSSILRTMISSEDVGKIQQESLKYYKDLKISLLLYNAILVASGTLIAAIVGNQEISNGFAIGGTFGFIYLLLLQRAVDKLPGPPSFESQSYPGPTKNNSLFQDNDIGRGSSVEKQGQDKDVKFSNLSSLETKKFQDSLSGFRGPLTRLSWIIAILFLTSKYASGKVMITLKPQELLAGAAGFLTCKVAAVMAAFRTIPLDWKEYKK